MDLSKTYQPGQAITIKSTEDLPAFRFVSHLGSLCADEAKSLGINEVSFLKDENSAIIISGTILVESTEDINIGDDVSAATDGKAKKAVMGSLVNGRALSEGSIGEFRTPDASSLLFRKFVY
jgi:hypothetical protein